MQNDAFTKIVQCIIDKKCFCLNAGAGSGKTYTLVQTISYILKNYSGFLKSNNQRIMVITYTNAAANEISKRIGSTRLVDVSTIHTRMWELIKRFQGDLVNIHLEKITNQINALNEEAKKYVYYTDGILSQNIETPEFIDTFYKSTSLSTAEFKETFNKFTSNDIRNVGEFKKYVKNQIKYLKLSKTANKINKNNKGYTKVEYTPFDNIDHLHNMKFSHDTLLEYSMKMIESNRTLRRIIVDTYPFIFVDEYQDTDRKIISVLNLFQDLEKSNCLIGYYGDAYQSIYDNGIGDGLLNNNSNLVNICMTYNHRSKKKIVELGNKIRNSSALQESVFDEQGINENYVVESEEILDEYVNKLIEKININEKVDVIVLKNDLVAKKSGFGELYSYLQDTDYYKNHYSQISMELLSDDEKKMGVVPLLFFHYIKLYLLINSLNTKISQYIPVGVYSNCNLKTLTNLRQNLLSIKPNSIRDWIEHLTELSSHEKFIKEIVDYNLNIHFESFDSVKKYAYENLFANISDDKIEQALGLTDKLFNLDLKIFIKWFKFVNGDVDERIRYHTFHGTKGLEYDNVVLVVSNKFDREQAYYHDYFKNLNNPSLDPKYTYKRNLLYVASTRAKNILYTLFFDSNYNEIKENFEKIFVEVNYLQK